MLPTLIPLSQPRNNQSQWLIYSFTELSPIHLYKYMGLYTST